LPQEIKHKMSFDELQKRLGKPNVLSSQLAPRWLKDGKESFCRWHIPVNNYIEWSLTWWRQYDGL